MGGKKSGERTEGEARPLPVLPHVLMAMEAWAGQWLAMETPEDRGRKMITEEAVFGPWN